ncbi:MAG: Rpn family recombination-promoting nuclease/putative transposase [bacterium]|nr:Rpn family recombination-promoting nuclease/putative transposase [bacterium]
MLLELQSRPCYHMALRMLNYIVQFYLCLAENNPMAKAFPLPEVIPVVLYTGRRKWNGPLNISDLIAFRSDADPKRQAPIDFEYILLNAPLAPMDSNVDKY